jgi:hypothetical protein
MEDQELKRAIELSMKEEIGRKKKHQVVDLTDSVPSAKSPSEKKRKVEHTPEVVDLIDDEEDEVVEVVSTGDTNKEVDDERKKAATDREMKRKLAAEAALKRLENQNK